MADSLTHHPKIPPCPRCGHQRTGQWSNQPHPPKPGDFSVCIRCATIARFVIEFPEGLGKGSELRLLELSDAEFAALDNEYQTELRFAVEQARKINLNYN